MARENGEPEKASDKQRQLILDLCRRKQLSAPDRGFRWGFTPDGREPEEAGREQ